MKQHIVEIVRAHYEVSDNFSYQRYSPVRVRRRSWRHTAQAIQVKPVLFLQRVLGVIPGVPLFD